MHPQFQVSSDQHHREPVIDIIHLQTRKLFFSFKKTKQNKNSGKQNACVQFLPTLTEEKAFRLETSQRDTRCPRPGTGGLCSGSLKPPRTSVVAIRASVMQVVLAQSTTLQYAFIKLHSQGLKVKCKEVETAIQQTGVKTNVVWLLAA